MRAFHVPEAKKVWKSLDNLLLDHLLPPSEDGQKQNQIYGGLSLANDKAVDGLDVFFASLANSFDAFGRRESR